MKTTTIILTIATILIMLSITGCVEESQPVSDESKIILNTLKYTPSENDTVRIVRVTSQSQTSSIAQTIESMNQQHYTLTHAIQIPTGTSGGAFYLNLIFELEQTEENYSE